MDKPLRVLDPACGSGSFLLGAYGHLLEWHLRFYTDNDPESWAKLAAPPIARKAIPDEKATHGDYKLTTHEKKRILTDHIFGVDIDAQAVEVTKLSLLLKVLEGENEETLQPLLFAKERALPDLSDNIRCGNSLIGSDFYAGQQATIFDEEEQYRINAFDWDDAFKDIMKTGGFEAVIGNPPYVLLQTLNQPDVFTHLSQKYSAARYKIDTYHVFIEHGLRLLGPNGRFGFITPNTFLRNKHAHELRQQILGLSRPVVLRLFYYPVFKGPSVDTLVLICSQGAGKADDVVTIVESRESGVLGDGRPQPIGSWLGHDKHEFGTGDDSHQQPILKKIDECSEPLGTFATAYFGIQTRDRSRFVTDERVADHFVPVIDGVHINRYRLSPHQEWFDYREEAIKSGGKRSVYEQERICVRQIGAHPIGTFVPAGLYSLNTMYSIFFTKEVGYRYPYLLGIICSTLMQYIWLQRYYDQKRTFPKIKKAALLGIPIRRVDFDAKAEVAQHDRLVDLVQSMLDMNERVHGENGQRLTPQERRVLEGRIASTDREIDRLVYDLYRLTDEEIAIVEEATKS